MMLRSAARAVSSVSWGRIGTARYCASSKVEVVDDAEVDATPPFKPADAGFGSSSPWAVFDAPEDTEIPEEERALLNRDAVKIPMNGAEEATCADRSDILKAYETHLQRRSSTHLGYPYNLTHRSQELDTFMRYSINNLGDPFESSNYGVHSRQFEVAVIDFFARLWKCEPDE